MNVPRAEKHEQCRKHLVASHASAARMDEHITHAAPQSVVSSAPETVPRRAHPHASRWARARRHPSATQVLHPPTTVSQHASHQIIIPVQDETGWLSTRPRPWSHKPSRHAQDPARDAATHTWPQLLEAGHRLSQGPGAGRSPLWLSGNGSACMICCASRRPSAR